MYCICVGVDSSALCTLRLVLPCWRRLYNENWNNICSLSVVNFSVSISFLFFHFFSVSVIVIVNGIKFYPLTEWIRFRYHQLKSHWTHRVAWWESYTVTYVTVADSWSWVVRTLQCRYEWLRSALIPRRTLALPVMSFTHLYNILSETVSATRLVGCCCWLSVFVRLVFTGLQQSRFSHSRSIG